MFSNKGGLTQNPVADYEPACDQRQSSHMQQEHHHRAKTAVGHKQVRMPQPDSV